MRLAMQTLKKSINNEKSLRKINFFFPKRYFAIVCLNEKKKKEEKNRRHGKLKWKEKSYEKRKIRPFILKERINCNEESGEQGIEWK